MFALIVPLVFSRKPRGHSADFCGDRGKWCTKGCARRLEHRLSRRKSPCAEAATNSWCPCCVVKLEFPSVYRYGRTTRIECSCLIPFGCIPRHFDRTPVLDINAPIMQRPECRPVADRDNGGVGQSLAQQSYTMRSAGSSSEAVASSSRSQSGSKRTARTTVRRCCSPGESLCCQLASSSRRLTSSHNPTCLQQRRNVCVFSYPA